MGKYSNEQTYTGYVIRVFGLPQPPGSYIQDLGVGQMECIILLDDVLIIPRSKNFNLSQVTHLST